MTEEKQKLRTQKGKLRKQEKKYNNKQENRVTDNANEKLAVGKPKVAVKWHSCKEHKDSLIK